MSMHQPGEKARAYEAYDRLVVAYDKMIGFNEQLPSETEVFQSMEYMMNVLRAYLVNYDSVSDGGLEAYISAVLDGEPANYIEHML